MVGDVLGLGVAMGVSRGVTRPVRRLLEGTRAVEAGRLDQTLAVTSRDEISLLTTAFNRMVEQRRLKQRLRETLGKYADPRDVEGLIAGPTLAPEGHRRAIATQLCELRAVSS